VPAFRERTGPGERAIPALRAPDGTLVYLIEEAAPPIWEDDFALAPATPEAAPLAGVDHIAQALDPGMLDGFALFWRAVFGLTPDPLWELPDPYGLVRSRAFVAPGGALRIPLNASESGRTATGRFVSAFAGAGVHHLAFSTPDAAAMLDAHPDAALLRLPQNAFDDLAARFGLDDATRDALATRHLLLDQDARGGRFRHAYSRSFDDRFFLEICERRDGYAGFGAANAGVRLAAQRAAR
jgi:4-hydroxyphenylpyruvate dioxygenase